MALQRSEVLLCLCYVETPHHSMPLLACATQHVFHPGILAGFDNWAKPAWCCSSDAPEDLDDEDEEAPEDRSEGEDTKHTEADSEGRQHPAPSASGGKGVPEERLQEPDSFSRVQDLGRDEQEIRQEFPDWPGIAAAIEIVVPTRRMVP